MSIANIKTGERIQISMDKGANINWDAAYVTIIDSVADELVSIHAPIIKGKLIKLPLHTDCTIRVATPGGYFTNSAKIMEYLSEGNIAIFTLKLTKAGEVTQRRDFFRLVCSIPITFVVLKENGEPADGEPREAIMRDVGGGGMRMLSKDEIATNAFIRLDLQLKQEELMMFGQILRKEIKPYAVYPYQYRVRFSAMSNTEQDKLIKYIYQEQLRVLQRA